jgi:hypothetical protein
MAAEILTHDVQEGREVAWHKLTIVRPDLAIDKNRLTEWDFLQAPMYVQMPDGTMVLDPEFKRLVPTDAPIIVGNPFAPSYRPLSNKEFLQLLKDSVNGTGHELWSIGTLKNRTKRFASFKVNGLDKFVAGGREFKSYLSYGDGLTDGTTLWAVLSNTCTVCANTNAMNLAVVEAGGGIAREKHTKNLVSRLPKMADLVDKACGVQKEFALAFEQAATVKITEDAARNVYAGFILPDSVKHNVTRSMNTVNRLTELFKSGRGNRGESRADLYQGVTEYYTHESSGKAKDPQRQFVSSDFGTGNARKQEFWSLVNDDDAMEQTAERGAKMLVLANKA